MAAESRPVCLYGDDDARAMGVTAEQHRDVADDLPWAQRGDPGPAVVEEFDVIPARRQRGVRHDDPMTAGAEHGEPPHCVSPVNRAVVASPSAATP